MQRMTRRGLLAGLSLPAPALAQGEWPSRPLRLVVPFAPAGALDALARILAPKLAEHLGQPVVVENRPGAAGNIGSEQVARATPDGHTLLFSAAGNYAINQFLYAHMPYAPERDLAPVAVVARTSHLLVANRDFPVRSLAELVAWAKAHPGQLSYGSAGTGTVGQLGFEAIRHRAGFAAVHVTYRSSAEVLTAVLSGQVQVALDVLPSYQAAVRDGLVRALAVGTEARAAALPEVPTVAESGLPGFSVFTWWAVGAPAATPAAVLARLNHAVNAALAMPDLRERFAAISAEPVGGTLAETGRFIAAETAKWREFVRETGVRLE